MVNTYYIKDIYHWFDHIKDQDFHKFCMLSFDVRFRIDSEKLFWGTFK